MKSKGREPGSSKKDAPDNEGSDAPPDASPSGFFPAGPVAPRRNSGWIVAEQFISQGFHYRILRKPIDADATTTPGLTKREADAVELACQHLSNKEIASQLDVSPSTVGVLLFRAAAKLQAKSRSELIAAYRRHRGL